jgi:hypothetical protein
MSAEPHGALTAFQMLNKAVARKIYRATGPTEQNSKSEYRNPKQAGNPITLKSRKRPNPEADLGPSGIFSVSII